MTSSRNEKVDILKFDDNIWSVFEEGLSGNI